MKLQTGIHYNVPAKAYHADCCPEPSLSSSVASILLAQSPLHAAAAHPRLNPNYRREDSETFDLGTAAHAYILEGDSNFVIVEANDWRTKAAQEARDMARNDGLVPILARKMADVEEMAREVKRQLKDFDAPVPLTGGRPEVTLCWQEDDIWLRARLDWLHDDGATIDDLKTCADANPAKFIRTSIYGLGMDVQAALYSRGIMALTKKTPHFRYIAAENAPPFAISVIDLSPQALNLAHDKVEHAIAKWRECVNSGTWPAYTRRVHSAEPPAWALAEQEARAVAQDNAS